jgi:glycosyltransferase involved in cell wall biosynthesis
VKLAEYLIARHWTNHKPDVLHVSHVFEGFTGDAVVPRTLPSGHHFLKSATLYDLIPLRFPDEYLADAAFGTWYRGMIGVLQQFDLLLAISESSRRDAIELLNIHPDRIATVWGGVSDRFFATRSETGVQTESRNRLGIAERYLLYTGGDDHRKNLLGALKGFALVPGHMRRNLQLVIACSVEDVRLKHFRRLAADVGLSDRDVVFTGYVSDDDLRFLYQHCEFFVFPSLYEGFGLPVLEAMACGAAVIGGDNSSIRELIARPDALFDAGSAESLAERICQLLTSPGHVRALREHGTERVKDFTWAGTAQLADDALAEALRRRSQRDVRVAALALPKRRLALFSPLPPCRSGIADHSAALLPHLLRYFDIEVFVDGYEVSDAWISANIPVRAADEFEHEAHRFDAVMYEFGNSEFHAHMLPILARFPGIVSLHDAYLSGLFAYLEHHRGERDAYVEELLYSHGPRARRYFARESKSQDPVMESVIELPCTKRVLDQAIGVISHSPFNLEVSRANYPEGWQAPFKIVPQLVRIPPPTTESLRAGARRARAVPERDFVISTFGHIAWTKCGDLLLAAFEQSRAVRSGRARLLFVGELARDEFGSKLKDAIARSPFRDRIGVTGFQTPESFAQYLLVTDLALQLRKNSRGGTPKGVLDCLSHGVPVVVNDDASYRDYPKDVVCKVSASPDVDELTETIDRYFDHPEILANLASAGRTYVEGAHHPELSAAHYALVIHDAIERHEPLLLRNTLDALSGFKADASGQTSRQENDAAEELRRQMTGATRRRPRLLIDVSHLSVVDHGTGIPRVVRGVVRAASVTERAGIEPVPVRLDDAGNIRRELQLMERWGVDIPTIHQEQGEELEPSQGDTLLMLDSSWARIDEFEGVKQRVRSGNGKIITAIYDLLPLQFPGFVPPGGAAWFENWLNAALARSDGIVCISRAIADQIIDHIRDRQIGGLKGLRVGYWHLGSDFAAPTTLPATPEVRLATSEPALLMVGTIEPRKRHALALDAMELLWRDGCKLRLVIAGRQGWLVDSFLQRVRAHPEVGRRLHFLEGPSDADLEHLYRLASALLTTSAGEGFGLPLVEAGYYGLPVLANDLPVFREVVGDSATYVDTSSASALARDIGGWFRTSSPGSIRTTRPHLSWEASTEQLLDVVVGNNWYHVI